MKVAEANLSQSMKFVYDRWIKPRDTENLLGYWPVSQRKDSPVSSWIRENPTTGIIYLKKHPQAKIAWVLVKFERKDDKQYGIRKIPQQRKTIKSLSEFEDYFGVTPNVNLPDDFQITITWDRQEMIDKQPRLDFDETTPNFYMYTNHLKVNVDKLVNRLYRLNEIIEETGPIDGLFTNPYSDTNLELK